MAMNVDASQILLVFLLLLIVIGILQNNLSASENCLVGNMQLQMNNVSYVTDMKEKKMLRIYLY